MATVYDQISSNNRKAFFLIFFFLIFVIFIGWVFSDFYDNVFILYFAVILSSVMSFISYYESDKIVLTMSSAVEVKKKEDSLELYRIVENLAITAGIPTPKIYILEEGQPNAFATGRDEKHAVIAVTRGLLETLNKRELSAVIAHEMAHIKGKDVLIGSIVVVLVGIIAILSDTFMRMFFFSGSDSDNKNPIFIALGIVGIILAPIAATLIQLAVSRKQEFKADASSILLTRDKEALISALIKISSNRTPLKKINNATAHLYISSPFKGKVEWYSKIFMTHPPVEDRVKALENL